MPVADLKKQLSDEYNITSDIDLNNHKAPRQPAQDEIQRDMIVSRTEFHTSRDWCPLTSPRVKWLERGLKLCK